MATMPSPAAARSFQVRSQPAFPARLLPSVRSEISLILDYQKLYSPFVDSKRFQGNLNYVFHIGHHGT